VWISISISLSERGTPRARSKPLRRATPLFLSVVFAFSGLPLLQPVLAGPPKKDCSVEKTGMVPINDLVGGTYKGKPGDRTASGGLFPGGTNIRPNASEVESVADGIGPLDANGNPDPNGRYGLVSIGMSNTKNEFETFIDVLLQGGVGKDSDLIVVNGAQGGVDAKQWADPSGKWWNVVEDHLGGRGLTPEQVAVAWVKLAIGGPTDGWPKETERLQGYLADVAQILKDRFPNIQIAYYSSRIYAGYTTRGLNPEPYAYESGFAVKWLIDDQLSGASTLNADPSQGTVQAPLITWGPYLWADGLEPRSDGLIWECKDFIDDGTHPSDSGTKKVADLLIDYFKSDSTARRWFTESQTIGELRTTLRSNREKVGYQRAFTLSGDVTADAECSGPKVVQIRKRILGTERAEPIASIDAGGDGSWSLVHRSGRSAEYTAGVNSTSNCDGNSSAPLKVQVRAKVTAPVPESCIAPQRIRGRVKPNHKYTRVRLQRRLGDSWRIVDGDELNKESKYTLFASRCSMTYRVVWPKQAPNNLRGIKEFKLPR
jgi:hypothetical protein